MMTTPKKFRLKFFLCFTFSLLILISAGQALALTMKSDHYQIQWGNFNISSGKPTSASYNLGITMGEIGPGLYSSANYKARVGFQYIHSIKPFSFTISNLAINLGYLTPQTPSTDVNTLSVTCDSAGGYQVLAFEAHPLKSETAQIDDTTCDNNDCDETLAGVWSQPTTYGFGFNIYGDDAASDFTDQTYFRQFANDQGGESAQMIMSSASTATGSTANVTYKVNVSNDQEGGKYETSIVYLAIPTY